MFMKHRVYMRKKFKSLGNLEDSSVAVFNEKICQFWKVFASFFFEGKNNWPGFDLRVQKIYFDLDI